MLLSPEGVVSMENIEAVRMDKGDGNKKEGEDEKTVNRREQKKTCSAELRVNHEPELWRCAREVECDDRRASVF